MNKKVNLPHNHDESLDKLLKKIPNIEEFNEASIVFQQLCDPTRLKILWILCHTKQCVCNISAAIGMSDPAVSHHLRNLKQNGLIKSERIGKEVHYSLEDHKKAKLIHKMIDDFFNFSCTNKKR